MQTLIKISLFSFILSFVVAWILSNIKHPEVLLDHPNPRKIHRKSVPLIGGFVIVITYMITIATFRLFYNQTIVQVTIFGLLFFLIGLLDDLYDWNYKKKLFFQIIVVTFFIFTIPVDTNVLVLTNINLQIPLINLIILVLWILGIINAYNFFDGINLLAGIIGTVIFTSYFLLLSDFNFDSESIIYIILIFSLQSFLYFNSHPSKMFLGDSGSHFIGFLIAALPIISVGKESNNIDMTIPFIVTSVLMLETLCLIIERLRKNNSPFKPDKNHLHHVLIQFKLRQRYVIGIIIFFIVLSSFFAKYHPNIQLYHLILFELFIFFTIIIGPRLLLAKKNKKQ